MKFSVLISVYEKENPVFFDEALYSILVEQTRIPDEVVIVKDGPLPIKLEKIIDKYLEKFSNIIRVIVLKQNKGLGEALRIGLEHCTYGIVARMDSDDISIKTRFENQIDFLKKNPDISVVGAYISEFYENPLNIKFIRATPTNHKEIKRMLKRRNPMNHVTVMFRKSDVIRAGGYMHLLYLEDYYLWVRMIGSGFKLHNIEETLVLVRTGENMYKRRSNPEYIYGWYNLQIEMLNNKFIKKTDLFLNMINILGFIYTPTIFKKIVYRYFLRKVKNK